MRLTIRTLWWLFQVYLLLNITSINGQLTSDEDDSPSVVLDNDSSVLDSTSLSSLDDSDNTSTITSIPTTTTTTTSTPTITTGSITTSATIIAEPNTTTTTTESTTTTVTTTTTESTTTTVTTTTTESTTTTVTTTTTESTTTTVTTTTTESTTTTVTTTTTESTTTTVTTTTESTTTTVTTTTAPTTTTTTTTSTTTTPTTTTTTPESCATTGSNAMNVTNRTSTMFTALIDYNCSLIDLPMIFSYNTTSDSCSVNISSSDTSNRTVNVTCNDIVNYAGRNWVFELIGNSTSQIVQNETFTITFEPLSLNETSFNITPSEDFTARVDVPDCEKIADLQYLVFRCNSSDMSNSTLPPNCTFTCSYSIPGSINEASLVRLPIPIADQTIDNGTFPENSINKTYIIGLDKVKNLTFENSSPKNGTGSIHFTRPDGNYNEILINCIAQDQTCLELSGNLTESVDNSTNSTSVSIYPVVGVKYTCEALTIKESFENVRSDAHDFNTSLEAVLYDGPTNFNKSDLTFNVTSPSDFDNIALTCIVSGDKSSVCSNRTVENNNCLTTFKMNGTLGCNYNCSFTTMKLAYTSVLSQDNNVILYPPTPTFTEYVVGSQWIYVTWKINEIANIRSFDIYRDDVFVANLNKSNFASNDTSFSYNYTNLEPFHNYTLHVQLNSNINVTSEPNTTRTSEGAPAKPTYDEVQKKLVPQDNNPITSSTLYVIDIVSSLFNDSHGVVRNYSIYVRQDTANNASDTIVNGTYDQAQYNQSVDYLAIQIPINPIEQKSIERNNVNNISMVLGNDTKCANTVENPCNGPLKASTSYRVIVVGCTTGGCTNVISKIFTTQPQPSTDSALLIWLYVVIPIVVVILIAAILARWKRRSIRRVYNQKFRGRKRSSLDSRQLSLPPSSYQIVQKRPKPLYQYVNLTNEQERALYVEYQELESTAPQYRQSDYEPEYATYNRYANIPARGPWNNTAVRLRGDYRLHDYINANEIKGLYSDKQYIACQGPLEDTSGDFWEMIIQYDVVKIVMLTRTEERNPHNPQQTLSKCYRYFPETKGESLKFDRVTVQLKEIENRPNADLEIRHLVVKDDQKEHRVYHYYFTGWPDFSVVDREKLLDLIETIDKHGHTSVAKRQDDFLKPMVIHCSAGVGRTGTYIAVDIIRRLIDQAQKNLAEMRLDVMGIVYQLRQDRGKMVQTKEQYILVNRCVEEYLRRINRLDEVLQQVPTYEDAHSNSDEYANCTPPDEDAGLEGSCSYTKKRKGSSSADNVHSNGTGVIYRQAM